MIFLLFLGKTIKYENKCVQIMSYAHPEVLVDTELSKNPENKCCKPIVKVTIKNNFSIDSNSIF